MAQHLVVGPPGVCLLATLPPQLQHWYRMDDPQPPMRACSPHITLLVNPAHTAKDLGPFARQCIMTYDWTTTPGLLFSPSTKAYKIVTLPYILPVVFEHVQIQQHHGRETSNSEHAEHMLSTLPDSLWSTGPTDAGLLRVAPITFEYLPIPVWHPQYKISPESVAGITETIEGLCRSGVLVPTSTPSPWNTPILPVKKGEGKYRMVHDLRAVNDVITTPQEPTPNPFSSLALLGPERQFYTVIDLSNAFFCVPLDPLMAPIFVFQWRGVQLTYTRLPQGFVHCPGIFNRVLRQSLDTPTLPQGVILVQYVDDLLLAAPLEQTCLKASHDVLTLLNEVGLKVSHSKLQCVGHQVSFLGRLMALVCPLLTKTQFSHTPNRLPSKKCCHFWAWPTTLDTMLPILLRKPHPCAPSSMNMACAISMLSLIGTSPLNSLSSR